MTRITTKRLIGAGDFHPRLPRGATAIRRAMPFRRHLTHRDNLAISELRRRKRRRLVSLTGFFQGRDATEAACEFDPPDASPLPDSRLVEDERREAVARAIATLPDKYRAPLVLRDVEGRSYEEIAGILRMSEGTVKSRINRARTFLREKLQAYL